MSKVANNGNAAERISRNETDRHAAALQGIRGFAEESGGEGQNRTVDTTIFRQNKGGNRGQRKAAAPDFIGVPADPQPPETTASRYRLSVICQSTLAVFDHERLAAFRDRETLSDRVHHRPQVVEPVAACDQHDNGDLEASEILLVLEIAVDGQEDVELA